jgi:crossover junction endodeoxyribonuclease RuvC
MIYIGIDPGKSGGIAAIIDGKAMAWAYDDAVLKNVLRTSGGEGTMCFVEKVSAMPKQGVTSMFNFGKSFGYILGMLEYTETPYQLIPPQKWKKAYSLDGDKAHSIAACKRLFPEISLLRTERCSKEHDGMAEALLIAEYCRRITGKG